MPTYDELIMYGIVVKNYTETYLLDDEYWLVNYSSDDKPYISHLILV